MRSLWLIFFLLASYCSAVESLRPPGQNAHEGMLHGVPISEVTRIYERKQAILKSIQERVSTMVPGSDRFEIIWVAENFNPGSEPRKADFSEFNFTVSYKTEPFDKDDIRNTVYAVISSAMDILKEQGFNPTENQTSIRCRTSYSERLGSGFNFITYGKGHWSYRPFEGSIQFRERWDLFTDGE